MNRRPEWLSPSYYWEYVTLAVWILTASLSLLFSSLTVSVHSGEGGFLVFQSALHDLMSQSYRTRVVYMMGGLLSTPSTAKSFFFLTLLKAEHSF